MAYAQNIQTHIINLERSPKRKKYMLKEVERASLPNVNIFTAVDAETMMIPKRYKPYAWKHYWEMASSEIACFESHILLWEKCLMENKGPYLILEDDIIISKQLRSTIETLKNYTKKFDLIHLDAPAPFNRLGPQEDLGSIKIAKILRPIPSTAAYLITPTGADKLLKKIKNGYCDHADDFITRKHKGYDPYQLLPAMAVQGMFAKSSSINPVIKISDRTSSRKPNKKLQKGPIIYRTVKEFYRCVQKIKLKFFLNKYQQKKPEIKKFVPLASDLFKYE